MKKKVLLFCSLLILVAVVVGGIAIYKAKTESTSKDMIERLENALGDEFKKQSMTELGATLVYGDSNNEERKIYYHILKTTFYEQDPSEITGLHTDALQVLFSVEQMDSCEEMKIQDWDAALYKKGNSAYLCWTYSPEVSYVLEYNPNLIEDSEIIKMAESAEVVK